MAWEPAADSRNRRHLASDSPDWLKTATYWNFHRLSATAAEMRERTRTGNFYAPPIRPDRYLRDRIVADQ